MSEFPNAEPRKKLIVSFDDEPGGEGPPPAAAAQPPVPARPISPPPPAPAPAPTESLWSSQGEPAPLPGQRLPPPAPYPTTQAPARASYPPPPEPRIATPYASPPTQPLEPPQWPPPPAPLSQWGPSPAQALPGRLSSWGLRVVAALIDGAIPFAVVSAVVFTGVADAALVILVLWWLLYAPLTMARDSEHNGQTFGKQLVGIRVVLLDGQPMTAGTAFLRDVVMKNFVIWGLGSILCYIPGLLNSLWPLWDTQSQCWHDKTVSTVVIDVR